MNSVVGMSVVGRTGEGATILEDAIGKVVKDCLFGSVGNFRITGSEIVLGGTAKK